MEGKSSRVLTPPKCDLKSRRLANCSDVVEEISQELADQAVEIVVDFYNILTEQFSSIEGKMEVRYSSDVELVYD